MNQLSLKDTNIAPPLFVPTCLRCGAECLDSEAWCFECQLNMDETIAEDMEAEHE